MARASSVCSTQQRRRLQKVATALHVSARTSRGTGSTPETKYFVEEEDPDAALALEHPLAQGADGAVEEFEFQRLRLREAEAVEKRQYRLATALRDLQECLDPRNRLTLEECCPPTVETQYQFFLRNGVSFCHPFAACRMHCFCTHEMTLRSVCGHFRRN